MKYVFYKQKPLIKRYYTIPIYLLPVLMGITGSYQIVPVFTISFAIFLILLTGWSLRIRILFTMTESESPTHILYNQNLCKITSDTFICDKSKFLIVKKQVIKLIPDVNKEFRFYKGGYRFRPYIEEDLLKLYPKNYFEIVMPSFINLFSKHATTPFFVFQIFCGILWCLDEYIYQALFTMLMLIFVEAGLVYERILSMKQFRTMNHKIIEIDRVSNGRNQKVNSVDLLPGDIIRISNSIKVPCDLLLLKGSCAVNEAILTGESIPLTKEDITDVEDSKIFDIEHNKNHVLFAGTNIIKLNYDIIECFVLRTGFDTVQGELIKKMLCSDEITVNDVEAFGFIGLLLCFAIIAAFYTCREGLKMGKSGYKVLLECILILTNVVPTELPLELTMAVNSCVSALRKIGIFCLEPFRIPYAGKVNVCCFDKTGTLTETSLDVEDIKYATENTVDVLRTCHTLVNLENKFTGDPLETAIHDYMNKVILSYNNIHAYGNLNFSDKKLMKSINDTSETNYYIKKKYLFSSELKRMTTIFENKKRICVSMKGAPEVIKTFLSVVPSFYDTYKKYAEDGYRVIALAFKPYEIQKTYLRSEVEKDMEFAGFILYKYELKKHAKETINDLKESNQKIIMITGDNMLTAMSVAKRLGIVNEKLETLGCEGTQIDEVIKSDKFPQYCVFARADPNHKEKIIKRYNNEGCCTLMCGDGTNDVGALKIAHVGIALVEAQVVTKPKISITDENKQNTFLQKLAEDMNEKEAVKMGDASVAAPFTAKTNSLECVLDIIRHGRSALVTTIQMYKILALNSLINAFSLSVLDCMGIRYGEYQLVISGLLVSLAFTFLTKNKPLKHISKERPLTTIFSKYMLSSIFLQVAIHIFTYFVVLTRLRSLEVLVYEEKFKPSLTNTALFLLSTAQQVSTFLVNYIGRPFRESLTENRKLFGCLCLLLGFLFYIIFEMNQEFSTFMEIVPLKSMKYFMAVVILLNIGSCFIVEKLCFRYLMLK